jgi:chemotaxis signal transduction protein
MTRFLQVQLGGRKRSISVDLIHGIVALTNLTPVPTAPSPVVGVTQIRGQIVPVLSLAATTTAPQTGDTVVLLDAGPELVAITVERTFDVTDDPAAAEGRLDLAEVMTTLGDLLGRARTAT